MFWVHASNNARFRESIRDIADQVKINGRKDPKANIFQLVQEWLRDSRKGGWILVLDNADDAGYLFESAVASVDAQADGVESIHKRLIDYLPTSEHGSIIITTRTRKVALRVIDERNMIVIQPMASQLAVLLLERRLGSREDALVAQELVAELEHMPLAISQAAAYISQRRPRCSTQEYLAKLRKSSASTTRLLLNADTNETRRDRDAQNSIMLTWEISFEHVRKVRSSAADLLSLMSFFNHQGIPMSVLQQPDRESARRRHGRPSPRYDDTYDSSNDGSDDSTEDSFEDDILTLRNYLFISLSDTPNKTVFEMHRLVQLATRKWLERTGQLEKWVGRSMRNLDAAFPDGNFQNWSQCKTLYPHALSARDLSTSDRTTTLWRASVLYKAGWFAGEQGLYAEAEVLTSESYHARGKVLGKQHPDTLASVSNLASVIRRRNQDRYKEAEKLTRRALKGRKKVLGKEHPETLKSVNNLALVLQNQGRYEEAEVLIRQALVGKEKVFGKEHANTLKSVGNLASVLRNQGRYKEAEVLTRRALEGGEKVLGKEHPDTLKSINLLASILRKQGKYKAAEVLIRQALEGKEKIFGKEHPETLKSINLLASILRKQGRYIEAKEVDRQAPEGKEKVLKKEHTDTLASEEYLWSQTKFWFGSFRLDDVAVKDSTGVKIDLSSLANAPSIYLFPFHLPDSAHSKTTRLQSCPLVREHNTASGT